MDKGTALVGIIAVSLFALPFVLDHRRRARRTKRLLLPLLAKAAEHQCALSHKEICGDNALGWDEGKLAFFHATDAAEGSNATCIYLHKIRSCEVLLDGKPARGVANDAPQRIELSFAAKQSREGDMRICLYRHEPGFTLQDELRVAQEWAYRINARMKSYA